MAEGARHWDALYDVSGCMAPRIGMYGTAYRNAWRIGMYDATYRYMTLDIGMYGVTYRDVWRHVSVYTGHQDV